MDQEVASLTYAVLAGRICRSAPLPRRVSANTEPASLPIGVPGIDDQEPGARMEPGK